MKVMMVDLDGTLFDTREVNYRAYQEAVQLYGYRMDYKYYCEFCNGRHYLDFLPQITTDDKLILSDIHKKKKSIYRKYLGCARVNWSLIDMIKNNRSEYKTALVTTASKENAHDILERFDLMGIFDVILTCDDISKPKPDPEGYLKVMGIFGAKPEECVVFEDSEAGIEAARKAGAIVYIVKGYN